MIGKLHVVIRSGDACVEFVEQDDGTVRVLGYRWAEAQMYGLREATEPSWGSLERLRDLENAARHLLEGIAAQIPEVPNDVRNQLGH